MPESSTVPPRLQPSTPRKGSLFIIFLTVFIDLLGFGMVIPLLPIYADYFTLDESGVALGLLMASFSAMQFLFSPGWGRLSDRFGRRPVLIIGLAGSMMFYTLFGVAAVMGSLALLFVSRIGAGIAGATISTAQAYIADSTSQEKRPQGMALIGMAFGMGFTFGPLFGFLAVPRENEAPGPWPGYAAAMLSALALMLAIFRLPESLRPDSKPAEHPLLSWQAWRTALHVPSIPLLLLALFVCIFSFANFETTLSLLIKGSRQGPPPVFGFDWREVCLTFTFIGLMLSIVQGGIVRRLAGRLSEGVMAAGGSLLEMIGFVLTVLAIQRVSVPLLFIALGIVVAGFAFMQPNLQSLLSRRSDPAKQGLVLGVGQSVSSLARILGAGIGIPLLKLGLHVPYYTAAVLMGLGMILILTAARRGHDYPVGPP